MHDISLMYSGGSGGFLLLHLMLLSGWNAGFQQNFSINTILQKQWDVKQLAQWKDSEIWPNNEITLTLPSPRLYFYCNPSEHQELPTKKIITIYTDIQSQIQLSKAKKAHWFKGADSNFEQHEFNRIQQQYYQNVRDPSWPLLLKDATDQQLQEMQQDPHWVKIETAGSWEKLIMSDSEIFNNSLVDCKIHSWLIKSEHSILLQDLVNRPHLVFSTLDLEFTTRHQQLLDQWINLHPIDLLEKIGIGK